MADAEHVALLKQGAKVWNAWRRNSPHVQPNLSEMISPRLDLSGVNLSEANLRQASFHQALLREADLRCADLTRAGLASTNLRGANLARTHLELANLDQADLTGATLQQADLTRVNFTLASLHRVNLQGANANGVTLSFATLHQANLQGTNLSGAIFFQTLLTAVNLTHAVGLDSCIHHGPSFLDFHTLQYGQLPLGFLRGCGVSDLLIKSLPSLVNDVRQFYSCFISYSHKDQEFAERLHADLQSKGVRCWFASEDMKIGDEFRSRIDESIHGHEQLLLILSENSVHSRWVQKEVETAFEKEDTEKRPVLLPLRLDDAVMNVNRGWAADIRRQRHISDFTHWQDSDSYQQAFSRLLRDLKAEDERASRKTSP